MQDASEVAVGLAEMAELLRFAGEPKFKVKAYERAARIVRTVGSELGVLVEQDRLRELGGIGAALSKQIQELWNTGTSEYLLRLQREHPEGAAELARVEGMTPRRIRALSAALGIRSVSELRAACAAGRVRSVRGFGEKTEQRLLAACERWAPPGEGPPGRLLLARALDVSAIIEHELSKLASSVHPAGALRRGEETVSELEFVMDGDVEAALRQLSGSRRVLRVDIPSSRAHLSEGVPVILHSAGSSPGSTLVAATGNAAHLDALRRLAAERGVDLGAPLTARAGGSEGLTAFQNEAGVYSALSLALVPPELRQGGSELEEAARSDFSDLIRASDVQGLVHCHTTYSDGKNSVAEMAVAAHALGMKYLTITDHSPSAHYAKGVSLDQLKRQWDDIAAAQELVPIQILRGIESDILAEGQLDLPDAVLDQLDVVIASIHARHRMDRAAMTARLIRAMSLPLFKIWGHALGRIIEHRDPIDCDVPAVLDALAGSRGAIELNADPHRLDLPPAWIPAARARGIPFVISVDAHSTRGFDMLQYGVIIARRGGVTIAEVLNAAPAAEFATRVRPKLAS